MKNNIINLNDYRKQKVNQKKCYEIKVMIRDSHPPTWRRLKIPSGISFNDLAAIIEIAFDWCGYHLYEFEVGATLHEFGTFITVPSEDEYDLAKYRGETLDSGKEKVDKYFTKHKRMKFIYDFGDNWIHDILIEKTIEEDIEYPQCIKAKMGAYPEDCGGTWGYEQNFDGDEGREELDIEHINIELEDYKELANALYNRYEY